MYKLLWIHFTLHKPSARIIWSIGYLLLGSSPTIVNVNVRLMLFELSLLIEHYLLRKIALDSIPWLATASRYHLQGSNLRIITGAHYLTLLKLSATHTRLIRLRSASQY